MTNVQVYDDEAIFFLYWKNGAQIEMIRIISMVSQGSIAHPIP